MQSSLASIIQKIHDSMVCITNAQKEYFCRIVGARLLRSLSHGRYISLTRYNSPIDKWRALLTRWHGSLRLECRPGLLRKSQLSHSHLIDMPYPKPSEMLRNVDVDNPKASLDRPVDVVLQPISL